MSERKKVKRNKRGNKRKRTPSRRSTTNEEAPVAVDLSKLNVHTLKRYKKHYKLKPKHRTTKAELVTIVNKHFAQMKVKEQDVIEDFIHALKTRPD